MDETKKSTRKSEIKRNWNIVKETFKETDFVINYCKNNSNKKCVEIMNHNIIYLIELNGNGNNYFWVTRSNRTNI